MFSNILISLLDLLWIYLFNLEVLALRNRGSKCLIGFEKVWVWISPTAQSQ